MNQDAELVAETSVCSAVSYLYSCHCYKDSYLHKTAYNVRRKEFGLLPKEGCDALITKVQ